jgi:hypothetical protein
MQLLEKNIFTSQRNLSKILKYKTQAGLTDADLKQNVNFRTFSNA